MKYLVTTLLMLAALNVALLVANLSLSSAMERVSARRVDGSLASLAEAEASLRDAVSLVSAERARFLSAWGRLSTPNGAADEERSTLAIENERLRDQLEIAWEQMATDADVARPNAREIELLSDADVEAIVDYRRSGMPLRMNEGALLAGDVDSVLQDPGWNPDAAELDEEARRELANLLAEYRYFARLSAMERSAAVERELERRRSIGAYVEYPATDLPERPGPVAMSHAEPADREGWKRMYWFRADEYPELDHQVKVERQQALRVFVDVHRVIADRGQRPDR